MASALRNLLVRVGADITGLRQGLKNAQKEVAFFGRNVSGSMKEMQAQLAGAGAGIAAGLYTKSAVQDAMRYEALMTTLGESMGASRKEFEKWQSTVGTSLGFSRIQSAETANILSLNFKKIATSQEDLTNKTTTMMQTAAIIANKRGMTMQDVSDRIRSAMNQEADGADELGVNVRIAAIKTSQAYQEMANGQPWDQLSEKMRQTILYHHILEQVSTNLGTTLQDTTAARMAAFTATLADVRLALGQAFLPIVYNVLPLLTKMAQALYRVLTIVGAFMRSLFGGGFKATSPVTAGDVKTTNQQAQALGDVGKETGNVGKQAEKAGKKSVKAAKKAKEAWKGLMGFDEVNAIKDADASDSGAGAGAGAGTSGIGGGGAGGGGLGGGLAMDVPAPNFSAFEEGMDELARKMDKFTKPIKDAFKFLWNTISTYLKEKMVEIKAWWKEHGAMIKQAIKNVVGFVWPLIKAIGTFIWDSLKMIVDGVIKTFMGITTFLGGVFTGNFKAIWKGIQDTFFGIIKIMFGFWNLTFIGGIRKLLWDFASQGIKRIVTFSVDFKKTFSQALTDVKTYWTKLYAGVKTVMDEIKRFVDGKVELMSTSFRKLWERVSGGAKTARDTLKKVWDGVAEWFARTVVNPIVDSMEGIKDSFSRGIGEGFKHLINQAITGFNKALGTFNDLKNKTPFGGKIPNLRIPHLARGGITNGPTLAVVGDNAGGREVVAPLDRLQGMMASTVVQAIQATGGGRAGTSGDIVLNIDGRAFARIVKPFLSREETRIGNDVRIRSV